mgnify:CR=1 FL=1
MAYFTFPNAPLLPEAEKLRDEVRAFLADRKSVV